MARLLKTSGATVTTEYYVNDAGAQMDRFAESVLARAKDQPTPEGGYPGLYVDELGRRAVADHPGILDLPHDEAVAAVREHAYRAQLRQSTPHLRFVFMDLSREEALARVRSRGSAHFFAPSLVDSQFAALESPVGEAGVLRVDAVRPLAQLVCEVMDWLKTGTPN